MTPITKTDGFAIAAPGADTNILATSLTPTYQGVFVVSVALATASVFNVREVRGANDFVFGLNKSVALAANDLYILTFGVSPSSTYNFQVETNGVIRKLHILEVPNGVAVGAAQGES